MWNRKQQGAVDVSKQKRGKEEGKKGKRKEKKSLKTEKMERIKLQGQVQGK